MVSGGGERIFFVWSRRKLMKKCVFLFLSITSNIESEHGTVTCAPFTENFTSCDEGHTRQVYTDVEVQCSVLWT